MNRRRLSQVKPDASQLLKAWDAKIGTDKADAFKNVWSSPAQAAAAAQAAHAAVKKPPAYGAPAFLSIFCHSIRVVCESVYFERVV